MSERPNKARRKEMHEEKDTKTFTKTNKVVQVSKKGVQMNCNNYGNVGILYDILFRFLF